MYKQKLCLGIDNSYNVSLEEQILLCKKVGFEEIFLSDCDKEKLDIPSLCKKAREEDIYVQSLHAPFNKSDDMWDEEGELGDIAVNELLHYAEICADNEIPIMVTHAFIGFDTDRVPTQAGIERYGRVAKRAGELGVKLALENTEGDEFLAALMEALKGEKSTGFCWDSGHEQCYNYGRDLLSLYGDRLFCTHLNDNLGIRDYNGRIFWHDDLHLLPFDGIIDWQNAAEKLSRCGFNGTLTFELNIRSKPNRIDNYKYENLTVEQYFTEAYARACKIATMKIKADEARLK